MDRLKVCLTFLLTLIISAAFAQVREKCLTVHYNEKLKNKLGPAYTPQKFEQWVSKKIKEKKQIMSSSRTHEETYIVPVVVHIIHNGEEIGVESNIPLEQIIEQINTLNQDFRRTNPDASKTPEEFKSIAADVNIQYSLALQDPDGAPTTGIVRVNGKRKTWFFEDGDEIKKLSYWPAEDYLNIWVVNLGNNTLGFSQFPTSNLVPGLEEGSSVRETDGVVIHYREFGRGGNATRRSRGRTLTHEIGHFLGLKHIWGDDDGTCDGDDHVDDTPNQGGPNNVCPGFPSTTCGNSSDMYMNYLDYTPDTCMNMFTEGQKLRMRVILENSPRRQSLLSSQALIAPARLNLDAAITKIVSPTGTVCGDNVSPVVIVRNMGTIDLTKVTFDYALNNGPKMSVTEEFALKSFDSAKVALPALNTLSVVGDNTFTISVRNPNNGIDQREENDAMTFNYYYAPEVSVPYLETFSDLSLYSIRNLDNLKTWEIATEEGNGVNNKAAFLDLFSNQTFFNERDILITPSINASNVDSLSLSFKYAYAPLDDFSSDALTIRISVDCGNSFTFSNEVYFNSGSSLATSEPTSSPFVPSLSSHWRTECLNLENYAGYGNIQIAFIASSGMGNNLYIDDVELKFGNCNFGFPVGVEKDKKENYEVNVYPNPNDGKMYLDLQLPFVDDLELTVTNLLGEIVLKDQLGKTNTLHHRLEIPAASAGIHVVKIKGNKINLNKKIIVEK